MHVPRANYRAVRIWKSAQRLVVTALVQAGADQGQLRSDVDPTDVMIGISGVSLVAGTHEQRDQAGRLLDLLLDGLRYRPP